MQQRVFILVANGSPALAFAKAHSSCVVNERSPRELMELYGAVGWSAYTEDPERLKNAIDSSYLVLAARSEDGELIGLARTVSDGLTIAYLQDLLVLPDFQRAGVGGALLDEVLRQAGDVRQVVLLTDDEPGQRAFYESRGMVEAHDARPRPLRSFVRLR